MNTSKRWKEMALNGLKYIALSLTAFVILMPVMWFMTSSFKTNAEVFSNINPFSLSNMFLGNYSFDNYQTIFREYNFLKTILNTLLVCLLTIVFGITICSMAGYALAKMNFKGKKIIFLLVLFSIMVPFDAIAIPLYAIITKLKWVDTHQALIVPSLANGMVIFMFKQFFRDINDSLIEAARIDGSSEWMIFCKIILPISKPGIISGGLVMFTAQWNAFMWPLLCARSENLKMLQVALTDFQLENGTMWAELFAGITLSMLIPCVILIPFQKYYIRGMATSGMKE